jgi:hypothetical protein
MSIGQEVSLQVRVKPLTLYQIQLSINLKSAWYEQQNLVKSNAIRYDTKYWCFVLGALARAEGREVIVLVYTK